MKIEKDTKFLIVGLGLLGGSYAAALKKSGYIVGAIDKDENAINTALERGIISSGQSDVTKEYVGGFDIVIFALYPHVFREWIEKYQNHLKSGALLTDVTGVKCSIVYPISKILRNDVEFIGAHPMAGREVSGVENATDTLFCGANYIVTPTDKSTKEAIECCKEIGRIIGCGKISCISPEQHDEMIGFLSQLTHCIAVALMTCKSSEHLVDYTGDSFRDLTRIAKINDSMWSELFLENKDVLLCQMDLFLDKFKNLRNALADENENELREAMRLSTKRRKYFDK